MTQYDNTIEYCTVTGTVVSSKKFTETNVSISGGGASVSGYGRLTSVTTNPIHVSDDSYINHEIWLTTDDGKEKSVKLCGSDIPLREGQKITLIYLMNKGVSDSIPCVLINHNNRKYYKIMSDASACVALRLCSYQESINHEKTVTFTAIIFVISGFFSLTIAYDALKKHGALLFFIPFIISIIVAISIVSHRKSKNNHIQQIIDDFNSKLNTVINEVSQQVLS